MNAFKQKYKFSPTFKIGTLLILIFSGIAIAFGVGLFIFGMAYLFQGVFQDPRVDSNVTWGSVMMVLGFYVSMMNAFSLFLAANAMNKKRSTSLLLLAIISIAGVISMIGGIIILFTPIDGDKKTSKPENDGGPTFDHKNKNDEENKTSSTDQTHQVPPTTMSSSFAKREVEVIDN